MDPITTAIVAALLVKEKHGAASASLQDDYTRVRDALISTADSADASENVLSSLEANPTSPARQLALDELLMTIPGDQQVTVVQLAIDLIEQVMAQRHGARILQQMDAFLDIPLGSIIIHDSSVQGVVAGIIRRGKTNQTLGPIELDRPPGNITVLATPPIKPSEGTDSTPTLTPTEDNPDV